MIKRALYGMDTRLSAHRVEQRVLTEIRQPQKNKKLFQLIPVAILLVAACFFLYSQVMPEKDQLLATTIKDALTVEVSPLTEKDVLLYTNSRVTEEELRANYRAFLFSYHLFKDAGDSVTIEHPQYFKNFMNSIDTVERYATGGGWSQNNTIEDFAHEEYRFVFDMKGLTEEQFKEALKQYELVVSWTDEQNQQVEERISLGEHIEFVGN